VPDDTVLCGRPDSSYCVTVRNYLEMEHARDRDGLAQFINRRLSERYIAPVSSGAKNGFAIMACACLLIETFESFYKGWKSTQKKGRGQQAVKQFFGRWHRFSDFRGFEKAFYSNVRCGILHQGETQRGWRVTRESSVPVFLANSKTINATKFMKRVSLTLHDYQSELCQAEWNQIVWRNFRQKMSAILENCEG
jgi:hypothetical protein